MFFYITPFHTHGANADKLFSNVFTVETDDFAAAAAYVNAEVADFRALLLTTAVLRYIRISTTDRDGVNFVDVPVNLPGTLPTDGNDEPDFVVARATASVGFGDRLLSNYAML